jgi:hypothetical protein
MRVISWRRAANPDAPLLHFVDGSANFGVASCPGTFEKPNRVFVTICLKKGFGQIIYWVDDLVFVRTPINTRAPWRYSFELQEVLNLASDLGIPLSPDKIVEFASKTRYIGFDWYWETKEVRLPESKRITLAARVASATSLPSTTLKSLQSIIGSLGHAAMVVPEGPANTRGLHHFLSSMSSGASNCHVTWHWSSSALRDLSWWSSTLQTHDIGMKLCTEIIPTDLFKVYSDASTSWGVGVVIGNEYDRFKLADGWQSWDGEARDIGWAEFAGVELAIYFLLRIHRLRNRHILVHVDNQGVTGAWAKRSSRNPAQNTVLARIIRMLLRAQCHVTMAYVESQNNPADTPSHSLSPSNLIRSTFPGFPTGLKNVLLRA